MIIAAFLIQAADDLFRHHPVGTQYPGNGMVDRAQRLPADANINLSDAGTAKFIFQLQDESFDIIFCFLHNK